MGPYPGGLVSLGEEEIRTQMYRGKTTQRHKEGRINCLRSGREVSEGTDSTDTLISDFWPLQIVKEYI